MAEQNASRLDMARSGRYGTFGQTRIDRMKEATVARLMAWQAGKGSA